MRKSLVTGLALAAVGSFLVVGSALAAPITGGISLSGTFAPVDVNGQETSIELATGIDFGGYYTDAPNNTFFVNSATDDLSGVLAQVGDIYNFQFDDFVSVTPLWSVGGFSFAMDNITYDKDKSGTSYYLNVYGTGTLSSVGYDDTSGNFNFTGQGADDVNFSWSASTATSPVPEPATMLLFGTGLAGLAAVARRKKKN